MQILSIISTVITVIGKLTGLIQWAEKFFPGKGNGEIKKEAVTQEFTEWFEKAIGKDVIPEKYHDLLDQALSMLIDFLVAQLKEKGAIKTPGVVEPATPAEVRDITPQEGGND